MRSATDFLPWLIRMLTNFATSLFEYFGSGRISRLGTSLRRGISSRSVLSSSRLGLLGAVFRAALLAILDAGRVQRAAHHVIANTRQILDPAAADQHDRVLLQIV